MVPIVNIIIIKVIKKLKNILYRIKIISLTIIINIAKNVNIITSIKIIMQVIIKFKIIHILTTKLKKINMNTSMGNLVRIITIKIINIKDTIIMIIIIKISMSMHISMIMDIAIKVSVWKQRFYTLYVFIFLIFSWRYPKHWSSDLLPLYILSGIRQR